MKKSLTRSLVLLSALLVSLAHAGPAEDLIRARLKTAVPDAEVTTITPMPANGFPGGLYLVGFRNYDPLIATGDGRYLIQGDLLEIRDTNLVSVSDQALAGGRSQALAKVKLDDMVIFPAKGKPQKILYVFTDVDCGYCRKFHTQVPELNQRGVEVRYLAFPRGGPASPVVAKLASVWCAKDRQQALTDAKKGGALPAAPATCKAPIKSEYELGEALGVRGTPALFSQDGMQLGGYVSAAELAKTLQLR
ncbi:MAG TPA: thioredoxin fold domain-containing protein [Moraxellaceae bacterium]|nr:thioredoxin fold domain-containing protein [Moraxellaceae bacterium]